MDRHSEVLQVLQARAHDQSRSILATEQRAAGKLTAMGKSASYGTLPSVDVALGMRPTVEHVNECWTRALVKKGLALDLVDDPDFRAAVLATARAGQTYVDAQQGDCLLPHRTKMSTVCIPELDKKLAGKVRRKIQGLVAETGSMIISDGWTSVQNRPIVNALQSTPAGAAFLKAVDTSSIVKDAAYIADFTVACIQEVGPHNVVAVCMDGACTASSL